MITPSEAEAVNNLLGVRLGMDTVNQNMYGSYSNRICMNGEEFHSRAYKRSKKSCSYIVHFCSPSNEHNYGEIQEFATIREFHVPFVKRFPQVVTNICNNGIAASSDELVQEFLCTMKLASHHIPVAPKTDSVLVAVPCKNILEKCIIVEVNEEFVFSYITPVIDVNCT